MIAVNQGEIRLDVDASQKGKLTLSDLGLKPEDLFMEGGLLRLVVNIKQSNDIQFYTMPTLELSYSEKMAETHWSVEFNGDTVIDTLDHSGRSTLLMLKKKSLADKLQRHENQLILHAQFTSPAHILPEASFITLF